MKLKNVGARVKAVRLERGMTTTELAKKIGVSQPHISKLEAGQQGWRSIMLEKVAKALGVTAGFLFADEKTDEAALAMLRYEPRLKKVLSSPVLSDLALKLERFRRTDKTAFKAVKTIIEMRG